jgi:non-specific serine/threonine protein kinase
VALPRQQTLRALIDWSYDLLTEQERGLLARLSVFTGGWTLAAAEQVCAGEGIEDWEVMDLQTSLVDKSLVTAEADENAARYRLLETVRQYAAEKLEESGETEAVRGRHGTWYLALAAEAMPQLSGPEQAVWLDRLESEHDNFRAALTWLENNEPESGLKAASDLFRFWEIRGYAQEGRARLHALLQRCGNEPPTRPRAGAHISAGALAASLGEYQDALYHYEQAHQVAQAMGDLFFVAVAKQQRALAAQEMGDVAAAAGLLEEAIALYQQQGRHDLVANNRSNLAVLAMEQGDYSRAQTLLTEALRFQRSTGDLRSIAITLNNLGDVARNLGDYEQARSCQAESLQITYEIGAKRSSAYALEAFAELAIAEEQCVRAVYLWGAADMLREANHCPLTPSERADFEALVARVKSYLTADQFALNWNSGRTAPLQQSVDIALADGVG